MIDTSRYLLLRETMSWYRFTSENFDSKKFKLQSLSLNDHKIKKCKKYVEWINFNFAKKKFKLRKNKQNVQKSRIISKKKDFQRVGTVIALSTEQLCNLLLLRLPANKFSKLNENLKSFVHHI